MQFQPPKNLETIDWLTADETSLATVTVTVLNVDGYPMPNKPVEIAVASGAGLYINNQAVDANEYVPIGNTNSSGIVTATLKTTTSGVRTIKARSGQEPIIQQGTVEFVPGPVSATNSQVTASPASVPADGQTLSTITVTAYDAFNNPISGAAVVLQSTGSASIIQPVNPTNSLGKTTGKITNTVGEAVTVSATVNGVLLENTVNLTFNNGDLSLSMTGPESAIANSAINYAITVGQSNVMAAENVTLQLQLPAGVTYISQNSPFTPTQDGQTLTWNLGTFAPGYNLSFNISGYISSTTAVGEILNAQADVTSITAEATLANNSATRQTTIVDGHVFTSNISPTSHIVSIGASALYEITIQNKGLLEDQYNVNINGLNAQWYSVPQNNVNLLPGETIILPLTIQTDTCSAAGNQPFEVEIVSDANGQNATLSASVNFQSGPQVSGLVPAAGTTLGSRNVTINWQTDSPSTGVLKIFPVGDTQNTLTFNSAEGTSHSIVVPNLERNVTYEWYVDAISDCGTTSPPHRTLTIGNGIVFVNRSKSVTVDRDYDQRVTITVRNDDPENSHTLTASLTESYEDLLVNFVDGGSTDQTITLQPGESRQVTLAIHTQDAELNVYDLTASLVADINSSTPIHDNMTLHVTVLSEGDYTIIKEGITDPITLAQTYVITNHGKPITDLSLVAVDPATGEPAKIFLQPSLDHARLETGQSIRVTAYPIFTAEDAAAQANALQLASSAPADGPVNVTLQTVPMLAVPPINFRLDVVGAGVAQSAPGSVSCGGNKGIVRVDLEDCTMTFETRDWYCTNRPNISTPIQVPSFITEDSIESVKLSIVYAPRSNVADHNGQISFNGVEVGSYSNQVPTGQFSFDVPASTWQGSMAGNAVQGVQMSTQHPNPGHYVSATGYKLEVAISEATTYVCADSSASAGTVVQEQYSCSASTHFDPRTGIDPNSTNFGMPDDNSAGNAGGNGPTESSCEISSTAQGSGGDPINTKTGAFSTTLSDISFRTSAGELIFQRSYSSGATELYTTALGHGWTFNHDAKLIFPDDPGGMADFLLFQSVTGNQYMFEIEADPNNPGAGGSFTPGPGVTASLTQSASEYLLTNCQQKSYRFNLDGQLLERTDEQGQAFTYEYDPQGKLIKVSADAGAHFLQITYDASNRIQTVSDHAGRQVAYGYNAAGDLVSSTDVLGQGWAYTYDSNHRMTQIKDPNGLQTLKTEYDLQGRAFKQIDGNGKLLVNIVYNADGTSAVYNALGQAELHTYDSRNTLTDTTDPLGADTSKTYDTNFRPATITDAGGDTTTLDWSTDGVNLNRIVDPDGNETVITYDALNNPTSIVDVGGFLTTFEYDGQQLMSSTDALNQETTYTYTAAGDLASVTDALGHTTSYTYNAFGQRISMTDPLNHTWTYSYDTLGRLIDSTDPLGRVTHRVYDAAGRMTSQTLNYDAGKSQNEDNLWNIVVKYQYNTRGDLIAVTDTFDRTAQFIHDNVGRLITVIDPEGNINSNTYNAAGQLISTTDALGRVTKYEYDAAGRLTKTTDAMGNVTRMSFNPDGTAASTTDALGRVTSYTYDDLKRVITLTLPNGGTTHFTYDDMGNLTSTSDALGNETRYEFNAMGRVIKAIDALGNITENFYNAAGQLAQTKDARGGTTTFAYDAAGRQVSVTDALGSVTSYGYDLLGRQISVTDALGQETTYTYNELDRIVAVTDALGDTTSMSYDAIGQILSSTDPNNHSVAFAYDNLSRLISQTDALNHSTSFTYDAVGNQLTATDANGHANSTVYDALNRPISFSDANNLTSTNGYDAAGNLIVSTDALGNSTVSAYNALNQPIVYRDALGNQTAQSYNLRGELIATVDAEGIATHYEYDALGRLTAVIENYSAAQLPNYETNIRTEYTYRWNGKSRV